MKCPSCNNEIPDDAAVCGHCHKSIDLQESVSRESFLKNPFGLLAFFLFLVSVVASELLVPQVAKLLNIGNSFPKGFALISYSIVLVLGLASYVVHRNSDRKELTAKSCTMGLTVVLFCGLLLCVHAIY